MLQLLTCLDRVGADAPLAVAERSEWREEECGMEDSKADAGNTDHPVTCQHVTFNSVRELNSHAVQQQELCLVAHERVAPSTSHLGQTVDATNEHSNIRKTDSKTEQLNPAK